MRPPLTFDLQITASVTQYTRYICTNYELLQLFALELEARIRDVRIDSRRWLVSRP